MNKFQIFTLKSLRKAYQIIFESEIDELHECINDADVASKIIFDALASDEPCMIGRFGSNELLCLDTYLGVKENNKNILSYISGKSKAWWWNQQNLANMNVVAGFSPPTISNFEKFCQLMLEDIPQLDVLGSWLIGESTIEDYLTSTRRLHFRLLEPFWSEEPWTRALSGKKVLVVHPFAETILNQYANRSNLFKKPTILPSFGSLHVIQAVQPEAVLNRFNDWFDALEYMKSEIDKYDYDICLIGCGAYGFHLAAHVKRSGKKALHLGGALQLLFGIKGKRWEDPNYGVKEWGINVGAYSNLMNEHWVRPGDIYKPKNADEVEGACYW
jgi:hypothetical protein